ncbi:hypothetical protein [Gracilimonas sp.]|uniref:hypothetical protein n=1 Tax=Gracilimonas sp. TaxID=1974203 RepID=UPI003BAA7662
MAVESKSIDTKKAFTEIQQILRKYAYDRDTGNSLSDDLIETMATFSLIVDGILFHHEVSADLIPDEVATAIQLNWHKLQELIKQREEQHDTLWEIAIKGNNTNQK